MTSDWLQSGGTITVNASGTLTQDATNRIIAFNGGTLVNHGTVTFSKIAVLTGPLTNSGILNGNDSLYINAVVNNTGTIQSLNYLNGDALTSSGNINTTNFFNDGTLQNSGTVTSVNFFNNNVTTNSNTINFNNCTNAGTLTNDMQINGNHDLTNAGILNNTTLGYITITNDCSNVDTLNHDAHWYNDGHVLIQNDFSNIDILEGTSTGSFCVANNSSNFGSVLGNFDFCDLTTSGFGFNTGTISNGITYCNFWCWGGVKENNNLYFEVFPNPVKETLTIQFKADMSEKLIQIVNSCGQVVLEQKINGTDEVIVSRNNLPAGLYMLMVSDGKNISSRKMIFE